MSVCISEYLETGSFYLKTSFSQKARQLELDTALDLRAVYFAEFYLLLNYKEKTETIQTRFDGL